MPLTELREAARGSRGRHVREYLDRGVRLQPWSLELTADGTAACSSARQSNSRPNGIRLVTGGIGLDHGVYRGTRSSSVTGDAWCQVILPDPV